MIDRELEDLRKSIDTLDGALIAILAERFRVTEKVGLLKRTNRLPPADLERERLQMLRFGELADAHGLDPKLATEIMSFVIERVKNRHREISAECG